MSDGGDSDVLSDISTSKEDLDLMLNEPRVQNENYLGDTVLEYSEEVFCEHFRLSRGILDNISERYEASDYYHNQRGQHGNISALHRIISWLGENGKWRSEDHFLTNGFPNIICAIDGSHIRIDKPDNDPDSCINRKGYYSIQIRHSSKAYILLQPAGKMFGLESTTKNLMLLINRVKKTTINVPTKFRHCLTSHSDGALLSKPRLHRRYNYFSTRVLIFDRTKMMGISCISPIVQ